MAQERAFTDTDFALLMKSQPVKDAKYPASGGFALAGKKVKFHMFLDHPEHKNSKGEPTKVFSPTFGFDVAHNILNTILYVANLPFNEESQPISLEVPLKYPKKNEGPQFTGTSLRIGRDKTGRIYMTWSARGLPKVGWVLTTPELMDITTDGAPIDIAIQCKIGAISFVDHVKDRLKSWKDSIIVIEEPGNYGGASSYKAPASSNNSSASAGDVPDGWDDDIPF